jgi:protein PsiE
MQNIGTIIIEFFEKSLLTIVGVLTIIATFQELLAIFDARKVQLADLLLLFLYTEVLGMVGAFYKSKKIPITLPLFIAMTALARLIILQGKEMEAITLLYEAGAILILALACLAIRFRAPSQQE